MMEHRLQWRTECAVPLGLRARCRRRWRDALWTFALCGGLAASTTHAQTSAAPFASPDARSIFSSQGAGASPAPDAARPFPGTSQGAAATPAAAPFPNGRAPITSSAAPAAAPASGQPPSLFEGPGTSLFDDAQPASRTGVAPAEARSDQLPRQIQPLSMQRVAVEDLFGQPIQEVRVVGNRTIPNWAIERLITETRVGRPVNAEQIRNDKTTLVNTRWFLSVRERVEMSETGPLVIFEVIEAPKLMRVEFIGNKKFSSERLARETGLVAGHGFDVSANQESVQRIKELYREKGYNLAEVTLKKGGHPEDREVVIEIKEGPKVAVRWISFEGNQFVSGAVLKTKLSTKTQWFMLFGGKYDPELIRNDVIALRSYYEGLGFFDIDVQAKESASDDKSTIYVKFVIKEGPRYQVRNIEVIGQSVLSRSQLLKDIKLKPGDPFNSRFLQQDAQAMKDQYDDLGRPFAAVQPVPRFLREQPGWLDLVYEVDESKVCRIGQINIRIRGDETHTRTDAVRNRINRYLKPGELAKAKDIQAARTIVATDQIFDREDPPHFNIRRVSGEDYITPVHTARGQDVPLAFRVRDNLQPAHVVTPVGFHPEGDQPLWPAPGVMNLFSEPAATWPAAEAAAPIVPQNAMGPANREQPPQGFVIPVSSPRPVPGAPAPGAPAPMTTPPNPPAASSEVSYLAPTSRTRRSEAGATLAAAPVAEEVGPVSELLHPAVMFRGQSEDDQWLVDTQDSIWRGQNLDSQGLPGPQNYLYDTSPQGDPFGSPIRRVPPDFVDIDIDVTEGRTGRLMFGAGVNSNAGLVGNLVLQEDNFDITRFPRNWEDVIHGRAFRGGGQSFRIEAVPGTQVSRYSASWRTPYFMGTDFSFGVDGFFYNRFYENWTEQRAGGRLSLGYIINRHWTTGVTLRLESVKFFDFLRTIYTPQSYYDVAGNNFLSTAQFRIAHDTRDSAFLPSKGHFLEFTYEQAFGEFVYPRFNLSGSQYFTLYERADGAGKHILQLRGETGWTGDDTPVFERFYAGGFQSFRGFRFRGVTPRENSFRIGGQFMSVGTAEYQFPITAGDAIRGVVFSDFGTVDTKVTYDDFRVTAGFGFRFTIPAMGPAPLAFDFAWPILSESDDNRQVFSFYVGTTF